MKTLPAAALLTTVTVMNAGAATIASPTLVSGPGNIIDPPGSQQVDISFGTAETTLEARSDLRVLKNFDGFTGGGNNVVSNANSTLPDIQFQMTGSFHAVSGAASSNGFYATSDSSFMHLGNSGHSSTSTLTISFGTWNGTSFTSNQTVGAAGFTLTNLNTEKSGLVTFRDSSGTALNGASFNYSGLSQQDSIGNPGNHRDIYFGWDSTAEGTSKIASITITFVEVGSPRNSGFDDLAFTTVIPETTALIPEPAAMAMGSIGLGAMVMWRRRGK